MTQPVSNTASSAEPLLRIEGIVKSFGKVMANKGVSFDVRPGEIHCLLGENGAGKTVLMSILYGMYQPDAGTITYKGQPLAIHSPKDAITHRIGMVHQHFMLVPTLTVAENVVLGQHKPWSVLNDMPQVAQRIRELGKELGFEVNPGALVESLSVGEQQRVEILKTMYHGADLLILDEPTAVLTPQETVQLLHLLRGLADRGLTVIFITHKLEEVMQVSDRVTVLRDGRVIATVNTSETNPRELARMMVGRDVLMTLPRTTYNPGEPVLEVEGVSVMNERGQEVVHDLSFCVREREIVGVAGVSGNGQTELALGVGGPPAHLLRPDPPGRQGDREAVAPRLGPHGDGASARRPHQDGHRAALLRGREHDPPRVQPSARTAAEASWPSGTSPAMPGSWSTSSTYGRRVWTRRSRTCRAGTSRRSSWQRELQRDPRFMLVSQPTRGIDIGATEFVLQQILAQRERGSAILLISTELEELFAVSDRILVMYEGRIVGEAPADRSCMEDVGLMMAGKQVK